MLSHDEQLDELLGVAERPPGLVVTPLPGRVGVRICGDADLVTRSVLEATLASYAGVDDDLHLDLSGLTFADVGAVTVLVRAARRRPAGRRLVLHHPPSMVRLLVGLLWGDPREIEWDTT